MPTTPPPLLIDTHCHLDAAEFDGDREAVLAAAASGGVAAIVVPAVAPSNFARVAQLARSTAGGSYALGIHPMLTPKASDDDITTLRKAVTAALDDPRFVAVGEIGLDLFVLALTTPKALARQIWFLDEQLKIARDFDLPVLLHVRRAQDPVLAALRRVRRGRPAGGATGIAHAFNGSRQQADQYVGLGFRLGFGGAATHDRALRIRALVAALPESAIVLETDAPDIAPAWVRDDAGGRGRNAPGELPRIAAAIAALRGTDVAGFAAATSRNACDVLPRLGSMTTAMIGGRLAAAPTAAPVPISAVASMPTSALASTPATASDPASASASASGLASGSASAPAAASGLASAAPSAAAAAAASAAGLSSPASAPASESGSLSAATATGRSVVQSSRAASSVVPRDEPWNALIDAPPTR